MNVGSNKRILNTFFYPELQKKNVDYRKIARIVNKNNVNKLKLLLKGGFQLKLCHNPC